MPSTLHFRASSSKLLTGRRGPEKTTNAAQRVLLYFQQMPEWFQRQGNKWIIGGYRPISGSIRGSVSSLLYIHNESFNIYSHLIPAVLILVGGRHIHQYLSKKYIDFTSAEWITLSVFLLTAFTCLSLSATYHALMNHSEHVERFYLRLDMLGIILLISGDQVLGIEIIFGCKPPLRNVYWCMVSLLSILAAVMILNRKLQGPGYRLSRASVFVAVGAFGFAPLIHGTMVFGLEQMMMKGFPYTLAKAACLLLGTLCYLTRFPENIYPGYFDLWGSDAIFHVLVVWAVAIQFLGYLQALHYIHMDLNGPKAQVHNKYGWHGHGNS